MLCLSDGQWSENTTVSCKGQYYSGLACAINFQSKEVRRSKKEEGTMRGPYKKLGAKLV